MNSVFLIFFLFVYMIKLDFVKDNKLFVWRLPIEPNPIIRIVLVKFILIFRDDYHAVQPPSIIRFEPVMYEDASDAKKITAPTYSSLLAIRPIIVFLE